MIDEYAKAIERARSVYNQAYYLSKDLNFWQKRKVYKLLWKLLKKELKEVKKNGSRIHS